MKRCVSDLAQNFQRIHTTHTHMHACMHARTHSHTPAGRPLKGNHVTYVNLYIDCIIYHLSLRVVGHHWWHDHHHVMVRIVGGPNLLSKSTAIDSTTSYTFTPFVGYFTSPGINTRYKGLTFIRFSFERQRQMVNFNPSFKKQPCPAWRLN